MSEQPNIETGHEPHSRYNCIDAYKNAEGDWSACPCCGLRPKVWQFDNGRSTACGCWTNTYDHFSIHAESIMSVLKKTGETTKYDSDELRINWNHWCATGEELFKRASKRTDERW